MKTFFKNLENKHIALKNTKLLPILLITGIFHLIYFIYGFLLTDDPKVFQEYEFHKYYENNLLLIGALTSLLLFIFWIFLMSKQKSFKSFFQFSNRKIFFQFLCYFFISFCLTSFYYSFSIGLMCGIKSNYSNKELAKDIEIVNKAGVFLNFDKAYYSLSNRTYDFPFDKLTSTEISSDATEDYFYNYEDRKYRFWSVKETEETYNEKYRSDNRTVRTKINSDSTKITIISFDSITNVIRNPFDTIPGDYLIFKPLPHLKLDTTHTKDFQIGEIIYKENGNIKKAIVEIKNYTNYQLSKAKSYKEYQLNYYNYSSVLIPVKTTIADTNYKFQAEGYHNAHLKKRYNMNKFVHELLNSEDREEQIKKIMADFISLTDKYEIKRNIDAEEWFDLVYNEQSVVRNIIFGTDPNSTDALMTYGTAGYSKKVEGKNPYIDVFSLTSIFHPINNSLKGNLLKKIRSNWNYYLYLAFIYSIIVFIFRVSNIKIFITSLILTAVVFSISIGPIDHSKTYFEEVYVQIICLLILYTSFIVLPYILYKKNKFIFGVLFNLGLICFLPLVYTLLFCISSLQVLSTKTGSEYFPKYVYNDILTKLGDNLHPILLISGFIFLYYSIPLIKKTITK